MKIVYLLLKKNRVSTLHALRKDWEILRMFQSNTAFLRKSDLTAQVPQE